MRDKRAKRAACSDGEFTDFFLNGQAGILVRRSRMATFLQGTLIILQGTPSHWDAFLSRQCAEVLDGE